MREHLVTECETRYVLADRGDDTCRFDAECQRWLSADVPFAHPDDLVPVANACGAHGDEELVRRRRSRRRELEQMNLAPECVDARGLHLSHRHVRGSYGERSHAVDAILAYWGPGLRRARPPTAPRLRA